MDESVTHKQVQRVAFAQLGRNTAYEFILTSHPCFSGSRVS